MERVIQLPIGVIGRGSSTIEFSSQPTDKIDLFHLGDQGIFRKAAPFYESGLSLREIAKEIGVSKTSIRKALIAGGLDLRPCNRSLKSSGPPSARHHIGVAPYGYFIQNGRLVDDSREQVMVQKIMKLWSEGKTLSAIARQINGLKIRPRKGKTWDHSIIRSIVNRHESIKQQTSGGKHGTR